MEHFKNTKIDTMTKSPRGKAHVTRDTSDHLGEIPHRSIQKTAMNSTVDPNSCLECRKNRGWHLGRLIKKPENGGCFLVGRIPPAPGISPNKINTKNKHLPGDSM